LISCSGKRGKNNNKTPGTEPFGYQTTVSKHEPETIKLLDNGLMSNLKGEWITTILTDSIPKTREVFKWKNFFLGNLMISIKENDTLIASGERYRDSLKYEVFNSITLVLPERENLRFVYSPQKDLIYMGGEASGDVYRRNTIKDLEKIISDEKLLMEYVINLLFIRDYLPKNFPSKIKYIALDLETYARFTFDAIGIENQTGELEYFGFKFIGDTLNLYRTSSIYDDDSGFTSYKVEEIEKQYFKNN
jgi:hypothetical protein